LTSYIAPKLPNRVLPVTRGTDRVFSIRRRDPVNGDPMEWQAQVFVDIDLVRNETPTRIQAVIAADLATIRIESTIADQLRTGTTWRAVMSQPGNPTLETPLLVGTFERNDGK
jgi:hypothetical protein